MIVLAWDWHGRGRSDHESIDRTWLGGGRPVHQQGQYRREAVAKLASAVPDMNAEQVKRVCEYANTNVYLALHDKNKTAGAGSSYPQFELADPSRVIQDLSDGAKPTVIT
mgnify:CR=1 FL=1